MTRNYHRRLEFWRRCVPFVVAASQTGWELNNLIGRSIRAGCTQKQIAKVLGVSATNISVRYRRFERQEGRKSPVDAWFEKNFAVDSQDRASARRLFGDRGLMAATYHGVSVVKVVDPATT